MKINTSWESVVGSCLKQIPRDGLSIIRMSLLTFGCTLSPRYSECMTFLYIPLEVGCYQVNDWSSEQGIACSYTIWDNDLNVEEYNIDKTGYNYLEITKVDTTINLIEGLFGLTFIKNKGSFSLPYFQDSVRFYNGCFTATYL